jgi:hypothetical protein
MRLMNKVVWLHLRRWGVTADDANYVPAMNDMTKKV